MQRNKLMPTIVLSAICVCVVALLALVNVFTDPVIKANQDAKANEALREVMPEAKSFTQLEITGLPQEVTAAYKSDNEGYIFQIEVTGYKPGLIIMCGIDADGKITGAKCIASNETMDVEYELGDKYVGKNNSNYAEVVSASTAKLTKNAYKNAIKAAFDSFKIITGGTK